MGFKMQQSSECCHVFSQWTFHMAAKATFACIKGRLLLKSMHSLQIPAEKKRKARVFV